MTLTENWNDQAFGLGRPTTTRATPELDLSEVLVLSENDVVRAVWSGGDFHIYSNREATLGIGEFFLSARRDDRVLYSAHATADSATTSTEAVVSSLKVLSGLTWEQIARALGVSKRTVLLWAGGARVSNKNHELVLSLKNLVDSIPGDPDTRRNALLVSTPSRASALMLWVQEKASDESRVNAPVLIGHELMG